MDAASVPSIREPPRRSRASALSRGGIDRHRALRRSAGIADALAVLLHSKRPLHNLARAMGERDMRAIMQFVLLSMVILRCCPTRISGRTLFGSLQALADGRADRWISLGGYVAYKFLVRAPSGARGHHRRPCLEPATTVICSQDRVRCGPGLAKRFCHHNGIVSSVVRVLIEIAASAPSRFAAIAWPFVTMLLVWRSLLWASIFRGETRRQIPEQKNPAELKPALLFAALYAFVLLAVAAAKQIRSTGLYIVAVISGLTDLDAITLSTGRLADSDKIEATSPGALFSLPTFEPRLQVWHRSCTRSREPDKTGRFGHGGRGRRRNWHSPVMARRRGHQLTQRATEVC